MMVQNSNGCIFCKNIINKSLSYWVSTENGKIVDKPIDSSSFILYESDNFFVIPDIAPLTLGHVLIISKEHIRSIKFFNKALANELRMVVNVVDSIISNNNSEEIVHFEHGAGNV